MHIKIFFLIILMSLFNNSIAELYSINSSGDECKELADYVDSSNIGRSLNGSKVFVGKSRLKRNADDYYLWLSSVDLDGDSEEDLLAVDWHKRGGGYYLALYFWSDAGYLTEDKNASKEFLLGKKLSVRHEAGNKVLIPEILKFNDDGVYVEIVFSYFHDLLSLKLDSGNYLVTTKKNDDSEIRLIFKFDNILMTYRLKCLSEAKS